MDIISCDSRNKEEKNWLHSHVLSGVPKSIDTTFKKNIYKQLLFWLIGIGILVILLYNKKLVL